MQTGYDVKIKLEQSQERLPEHVRFLLMEHLSIPSLWGCWLRTYRICFIGKEKLFIDLPIKSNEKF